MKYMAEFTMTFVGIESSDEGNQYPFTRVHRFDFEGKGTFEETVKEIIEHVETLECVVESSILSSIE